MKLLWSVFGLMLSGLVHSSYAQTSPAPEKDFHPGSILLPDSTLINGLIKRTNQFRGDIWFKQTWTDKARKYRPSELRQYQVDTLLFRTLLDVPVFGKKVATGKTSLEKELFGQVITDGKIKVYLAVVGGYDVLSESRMFIHYIFQKDSAGTVIFKPLPVMVRMSDKYYFQAIRDLSTMFDEYPQIQEYLAKWKRPDFGDHDPYSDLISLVREIN